MQRKSFSVKTNIVRHQNENTGLV